MFSRKQSLTLAKQDRLCPPASVTNNPEYNTQVKHHIAICPFCSTGMSDDLEHWEALAESFPVSPEQKEPTPVALGQLRYIKKKRAGWRDGNYYTPPMVLTLDIPSDIPDAVTVAQTYSDITLAGRGDLILENDQSNFSELFIECWNTYSLRIEDLDELVSEVSPEVADAAIEMRKSPDYLPDWAMLPAPMTENDPRIFFREMEVEVGFTFSYPAVSELMNDIESSEPSINYDSPEKLRQAMQKANPNLIWPAVSVDIVTDLIAAHYHEASMPMAAADSDDEVIVGKKVVFQKGKVKAVDQITIEIISRLETDTGFKISGRIQDPPSGVFTAYMACLDRDRKAVPLLPEASEVDPENFFFYATFTGSHKDYPNFDLTLVCSSDTE